MNRKRNALLFFLVLFVGAAIAEAVIEMKKFDEPKKTERTAREKVLDEIGLDVVAIHRATDIINAQIERGEIRDMDKLQERVTDEVAFQKMAIREHYKA